MLFGSSGIRQVYTIDLLFLAQKVGKALCSNGVNKIILGRDTRTSGEALSSAFVSGVCGNGGEILSAGICTTPTVAYAAGTADYGCAITASHNPERYNGLKIFNVNGSSLTKEQQIKIEENCNDKNYSDWTNQGQTNEIDACQMHIDAILKLRHFSDDMHVVLDCGNGAGSVLTPNLFSKMGLTTTGLNVNPCGHFFRPSEPLPENLPWMHDIIKKTGASCGIVHDGDADRMMAFDELGRFIPGDKLLILFAKYLNAKEVVTTYDASMIIEEFSKVKRTPVGDAYVSEQLVRWGKFGGEPSGAWIFPEISYCPDGPYAAALMCEMASELKLSEEVDSIPSYPIIRDSIELENAREIMYGIGASSPTDGIRLEEEEGWCLIRASGTEPKIRITAEGKTIETAKTMLNSGKEMIKLVRREM